MSHADIHICLGITVYGPRIFAIAGIAPKDQVRVAGLPLALFDLNPGL